MSQQTTGYQLPAGDAFEEDLCCAIVFYPDRDEYRRALLGSLTYFATWIAWEKDEGKRGKDAALAWQLALEKTLECWNMACMEDLITIMGDLLETIQSKKDCCDDNITYAPGAQPTTEIVPSVGDPPATYGETAVADWDEWLEYLCYQAHAYVDKLVDIATQLNEAVYPAWIVIGLVAAMLAVLTFSGIGLPIAFGLAATVVGSLIALGSGAVFSAAATALEDAREDIVCALITGQSLSDAVEAALSSGVPWDAFYQFIDYDAAQAVLYEGGWDGEYLDAQTRDDCSCLDYDFIAEWQDDNLRPDGFPWIGIGRAYWDAGTTCDNDNQLRLNGGVSGIGTAALQGQSMAQHAGEPHVIPYDLYVPQVEIHYNVGPDFVSGGHACRIRIRYKDGSNDNYASIPQTAGEHTVTINPNASKEVEEHTGTNRYVVNFESLAQGTDNQLSQQVCVLNARVWCRKVD